MAKDAVDVEKMLREQRKSVRRRLELEALFERIRQQVSPDQKVLKAIEEELEKLR